MTQYEIHTNRDVCRQVESDLGRAFSDGNGMQTIVTRGHRLSITAVDRNSAADSPARDTHVICESLLGRHSDVQCIAERVDRRHRRSDSVACKVSEPYLRYHMSNDIPEAKVVDVLNGPRYTWTSDF